MLAHFLREKTHSDTGEVVDGEPRIARVVHRENTVKAGPKDRIIQPFPQLRQAEMLCEILEQDLNENTTARSRLVLVQVDDGEHMPPNRVSAQYVAKEARNVAQPVGFVAVNGIIVFRKGLLEQVTPETVELRKPLSDQAIELGIRPFLRATFDNHGRQLRFLARRKGDLHQLVATFFKIHTRHDRQVYRPPKIDQIRVALVFDVHQPVFLRFGLFRAFVRLVLVLVLAPFSEDLRLQFLVRLLVLLPLWVVLEDIEAFLGVDFIVEANAMGDLILFFDEIELLTNCGVILPPVLANLKQDLNHVLHPLVDIGLVQNVSKLIKHGQGNRAAHLL